jgi:hypothetical protein
VCAQDGIAFSSLRPFSTTIATTPKKRERETKSKELDLKQSKKM